LTLCGSWIYSLRIVKNIVLRKGGKDLTFVTYAPFNKVRYLDAPIKNVNKNAQKVVKIKIFRYANELIFFPFQNDQSRWVLPIAWYRRYYRSKSKVIWALSSLTPRAISRISLYSTPPSVSSALWNKVIKKRSSPTLPPMI